MPDVPTAPDTRSETRPLQLEGLGIAALYVLSFGWVHLTAGDPLFSVKLLAIFLGGLVVIPVVIGLPLVTMRRALAPGGGEPSPLGAIAPFAPFAFYGLQMVLVYLATTHAYRWLLTG